MCLQVNLDAESVLANSDAARWYTSSLVKQGLASDRDLPGLQNHACKRAYVSFFSINPLSRNRSIALYVLTFDTFNLFATLVCFTFSICSASSFAAIKYLNSDELILLSSSASRLAWANRSTKNSVLREEPHISILKKFEMSTPS